MCQCHSFSLVMILVFMCISVCVFLCFQTNIFRWVCNFGHHNLISCQVLYDLASWIVSCDSDAGETVSVVGDHNTELLKYFDCTRSGPRSAFDNNVVYQFEIMEYVSYKWLLDLLHQIFVIDGRLCIRDV